jgi:hypothetical protein
MISLTNAGPIRLERRARLETDRKLPSVRAIGKPSLVVALPSGE